MSRFDELTLKRIAKDFGGKINVLCQAGSADIVTSDEVIETGSVGEWEKVFDKAQEFAHYLKLSPSIMLNGEALTDEIDVIDEACHDDGVTFYYYDGLTLSNLVDVLGTSRQKAKQVAEEVAVRYGIGARSINLMKYQREMVQILAEINN